MPARADKHTSSRKARQWHDMSCSCVDVHGKSLRRWVKWGALCCLRGRTAGPLGVANAHSTEAFRASCTTTAEP